MNLSLNITVLIFPCQGSIIIYLPYPHNLHFLPPPLSLVSHTSFIITMLIRTLFEQLSHFVFIEVYYKNNIFVIRNNAVFVLKRQFHVLEGKKKNFNTKLCFVTFGNRYEPSNLFKNLQNTANLLENNFYKYFESNNLKILYNFHA